MVDADPANHVFNLSIMYVNSFVPSTALTFLL